MSEPRSLKYRTWELLQKAPTPPKEIARAVGMTPEWLKLFSTHQIQSPNVDAIQRLYEYLSGAPLFKD